MHIIRLGQYTELKRTLHHNNEKMNIGTRLTKCVTHSQCCYLDCANY